MRKPFALLLTLALMFTILSPVLADHSVVPEEGVLDETAALDTAVAELSRCLGCEEDQIRGCYYYRAVYSRTSSWSNYPSWDVMVFGPSADGEAYTRSDFELNALTGEVLHKEIGSYSYPEYQVMETPAIPRKDQMQPAEAVALAREMIREALELSDEEMNSTWRHYVLSGWNTGSEHRYAVTVGHQDLWSNAWHAVLDMDSGSVI